MRKGRRRQEGFAIKSSAPAWMTTYGDVITLLLCFFVVLFSISTIDARRFEMALLSLQGALGLLPGGKTLVEEDWQEIAGEEMLRAELLAQELAELEGVRLRLQQVIRAAGQEDRVLVETDQRGLIIRFLDQVLFDLGKAELKPEARELLDKVAVVLKQIDNPIRVEGHTCNLPINTLRFPSNWELSTGRASAVVRYLITEHGLSPLRLSAAGYGEYRPIASNDTEEGRRQNRRVDIVILRSSLSRTEPR